MAKKRAKKAHKSASRKKGGVIAWVEGLFSNKKKAKSRKSSHKKSAKRKSHVSTYSLKAKKSGSRTHKKYAK